MGTLRLSQDEIFFVNLSNAANATILQKARYRCARSSTMIRHNRARSGFSAASYNVSGNGGQATITVRCAHASGSDGAVSVQYATAHGSATAGDHTAASGALNWADGDAASRRRSRTCRISIAK